MRISMPFAGAAAVVIVASLTATPAYTTPASFSDSLVIFDPNGQPVPDSGATAGWNVFQSEGAEGSLVFSAAPIDPTKSKKPTLLIEPNDPNGFLSDRFGIFSNNGVDQLGFQSDGEKPFLVLSLPGTLKFLEHAGPFDATMYLDPVLQAQGFTAQFTSDVEAAAIPEPAALPLFATGLGAMGLLAWRKKRKVAAEA